MKEGRHAHTPTFLGPRVRAEQDLREQVLEARTRTLGPEHLETISAMNDLAISLFDQGDHAGAEKTLRHVLEARIRTLGPEHPDTIMAKDALTALLADVRENDPQDAE